MTLDEYKNLDLAQNELFCPMTLVTPFETMDEAWDFANATDYGLVASVFTSDREKYLQAVQNLQVGLLNWNRSTAGASSKLPFGGLKKSGNHFPTARLAGNYCTTPVACLENPTPSADAPNIPGLEIKGS